MEILAESHSNKREPGQQEYDPEQFSVVLALQSGGGNKTTSLHHMSRFIVLFGRAFWDGGVLKHLCKVNFMQFKDLMVVHNRGYMWHIVWFAAMWVIWKSRIEVVFREKSRSVEEMLESVKLFSWQWIAVVERSQYYFSCWSMDSLTCVKSM